MIVTGKGERETEREVGKRGGLETTGGEGTDYHEKAQVDSFVSVQGLWAGNKPAPAAAETDFNLRCRFLLISVTCTITPALPCPALPCPALPCPAPYPHCPFPQSLSFCLIIHSVSSSPVSVCRPCLSASQSLTPSRGLSDREKGARVLLNVGYIYPAYISI